MRAAHGVHVEANRDTVSVKGYEENNAKLEETIAESAIFDQINVDKAGARGVGLVYGVVAGRMKRGGQRGGGGEGGRGSRSGESGRGGRGRGD